MTSPPSIGYTGTDNLEIMASAVNYNRYLLDLIKTQARPGERIVDMGAGIGTFAQRLVAAGYRVECVEPDARQAAMVSAAGLTVHRDASQIEDASVDYLYSLNVLEHIEHDVDVLREWTRKLKPGGRMLIYVPAFQMLFSSMDRKVQHFRRYSRGELVDKMRSVGLGVERSSYADSAGFFASILFKWIGNEDGDVNEQALIAYDRIVFPISRLLDLPLGKLIGKNAFVFAKRVPA